MAERNELTRHQVKQLNVDISAKLKDDFNAAARRKGHVKKVVIERLIRLYIEGKVDI